MVTVLDGHPHALSFLAGINNVDGTALGVTRFGQAGSLEEVYRYHGMDTDGIVRAALDHVSRRGGGSGPSRASWSGPW